MDMKFLPYFVVKNAFQKCVESFQIHYMEGQYFPQKRAALSSETLYEYLLTTLYCVINRKMSDTVAISFCHLLSFPRNSEIC